MTFKIILVAAATLSAAAPAFAETTYYGTSDRVTAAREQNNANATATASDVTRDGRLRGIGESQSFGYPGATATTEARRAGSDEGYTGTRWRQDDTADENMG